MNQRVDFGGEDHEQRAGDRGQDEDPVGVDETVAQIDELPREVAIAGKEGGKAREARKDVFAAKIRIANVKAYRR
jgi:hypothetical protein